MKGRLFHTFSISALVVSIASLSIAFASFSSVLTIKSSASVNPNTGNINVVFSTQENSNATGTITGVGAKTGNAGDSRPIPTGTATLSGTSITNLVANFTDPGQYVNYWFYIRNTGDYTAYLNSVEFLGNGVTCTATGSTTQSLVDAACPYVSIKVNGLTETDITGTTSNIEQVSLAPGASTQAWVLFIM